MKFIEEIERLEGFDHKVMLTSVVNHQLACQSWEEQQERASKLNPEQVADLIYSLWKDDERLTRMVSGLRPHPLGGRVYDHEAP